MPKTLSVQMECWNCTNAAPTWNNGKYQYLAIEPDLEGQYDNGREITGEMHQICQTCFEGGNMEIATGKVHVYMQTPLGLIEMED